MSSSFPIFHNIIITNKGDKVFFCLVVQKISREQLQFCDFQSLQSLWFEK